jgi:hypothetical protein
MLRCARLAWRRPRWSIWPAGCARGVTLPEVVLTAQELAEALRDMFPDLPTDLLHIEELEQALIERIQYSGVRSQNAPSLLTSDF